MILPLCLLLSVCFDCENISKYLRQCFLGYPNISHIIKNTLLHVVFSTVFSVFGYSDETLSLVLDTRIPKGSLLPPKGVSNGLCEHLRACKQCNDFLRAITVISFIICEQRALKKLLMASSEHFVNFPPVGILLKRFFGSSNLADTSKTRQQAQSWVTS